jgi:hypothetical protein
MGTLGLGALSVAMFGWALYQGSEATYYRRQLSETRSEKYRLDSRLTEITQERDRLRASLDSARSATTSGSTSSSRPSRSAPLQVKIEPQINFPSAAPKSSVDIVVKTVSVYDTKDNGSPWDQSGPADLQVAIEITSLFSSRKMTSVAHDVTYKVFNENVLRVSEGDTIKITVFDSDVFASDTIGTYTKQITADTIAERRVNWSFGRVAALELEFQP